MPLESVIPRPTGNSQPQPSPARSEPGAGREGRGPGDAGAHTQGLKPLPGAAQGKHQRALKKARMPGSPARCSDLIGLERGLGIWILKISLGSSKVQPGLQMVAL